MPRPKVYRQIKSCYCKPGADSEKMVCDECHRREVVDWTWDTGSSESTTIFQNNNRNVLFNPGFSVGTVAVRGTSPLRKGFHHYFEIVFESEVYGTDMMVGVCTAETNLTQFTHRFTSLVGHDKHSWGFSYTGKIQHAGAMKDYSKPFSQYAIIGCHLDLWKGTLEFFFDRKPLGIAFTGLQNKVLYPIISSTSARSQMNLIFARSYPSTLQFDSLISISRCMNLLPDNTNLFTTLPLPPGLQVWIKNNFWWILHGHSVTKAEQQPQPQKLKIESAPNTPAAAATSTTETEIETPPAKRRDIDKRREKSEEPIASGSSSSSSTIRQTRSMTRSLDVESISSSSSGKVGVKTRSKTKDEELCTCDSPHQQGKCTSSSSTKRVCLASESSLSNVKKGKSSK